jgi:hypothetical protein
MLLLAHNLLSLNIGFVLMSFFEYGTHHWMLHKNIFVRMFPLVSVLNEVLVEHLAGHHGRYYRCFNREDDQEGKHVGLLFPLGYYAFLLSFISGPLLLVDWLTAVYFGAFAILHFFMWNAFHQSMHLNRKPWTCFTPWFKYVEYYHYLHRQHPNKNFNGCFPPIWDRILRTSASQTDLDRHVWQLIKKGEYVDRKGRSLKGYG